MTTKETIQMLERMLYPEPWEDYDLSDKAREALETAIGALEKQIPEKPTEEAHDEKALSYNLYCPACERVIGYRGTITGRIAQKYGNEDYCGKCGQAIDWSEDEV